MSSRAKKARHTSHHHYPKRDSFPGTDFCFCGKKRRRRENKKRAEHRETNEPLSSSAVFLRDEVVAVSQLRLRELLRHRHRACSVLLLCCGFPEGESESEKGKTKSELKPYTQSSSKIQKKLFSLAQKFCARARVFVSSSLLPGSNSRTKTSRREKRERDQDQEREKERFII